MYFTKIMLVSGMMTILCYCVPLHHNVLTMFSFFLFFFSPFCFVCHGCIVICQLNLLITHDKTQQRDKIAVKINDLKQKHVQAVSESLSYNVRLFGFHFNDTQYYYLPMWRETHEEMAKWWFSNEIDRKCSPKRRNAHTQAHSSWFGVFISLYPNKNLRLLMFYGFLLFQTLRATMAPWLQCINQQ